jgi:hypothetical protein
MAAFATAALASALALAAALAARRSLGISGALLFQPVQLLLEQTQLLFQKRDLRIIAAGLRCGR